MLSSTLIVRRDDSEANALTNLRPRLLIYDAISCVYAALGKQPQLLRPDAFGDNLLALAIPPLVRKRPFNERQRNVVGPES